MSEQIESYTVTKEDKSLADKLLARLDDLYFKDSRRADVAEFFAILRANIEKTGNERMAERDTAIAIAIDYNMRKGNISTYDDLVEIISMIKL